MSSIHFFSFAPVVQRNGRIDSDLASARYRIIIPSTQLARYGHKISISPLPTDTHYSVDSASIQADIVVFSKSVNTSNETLAKSLTSRGVNVVLDLCDNYFDHAGHGQKYRAHTIAMCHIANSIVTSTPLLSDLVMKYTGRHTTVITDPVEGMREPVVFNPQQPRLKLLWFGHSGNWPSLAACLPSLANLATGHRIELHVVTRPQATISDDIQAINQRDPDRFSIRFTPWTTEATWIALAQSDLVIIPSLQSDFHAVKSPNRLTESIWAGRLVVAHPIDSYREYGQFTILDKDMAEGVRRALANREEIPARIQAGQTHVGTTNSPYVIGLAWEQALGLANPSRALRLHISCDGTTIKGRVNIDITRAGLLKRPDLVCDGGDLRMFRDNSVEEVISSALALTDGGDFDALSLLREWHRVLKPAGQLVIQCGGGESANHALAMMNKAAFTGVKKEMSPNGVRVTGAKNN